MKISKSSLSGHLLLESFSKVLWKLQLIPWILYFDVEDKSMFIWWRENR
jgi:hypothetical protein